MNKVARKTSSLYIFLFLLYSCMSFTNLFRKLF